MYNKMVLPGGLHNAKPITDEVANIVSSVKAAIEAKTGESYSSFNPIEFATQTVAGVNYFVKVRTQNGCIHVRIYKDLSQTVSVHSVQTGKQITDPIEYF
ncbi:cystatin A2 [Tieghemostelium lacteum]|uniref:Cystatin A2 n=1 Tax=Tieghemostelium lacteum TaxID=361077 RepID=A0A151ZK97_TIELA|nr:cystatin A2 [Tieghemostelium lacteum]|eukprot:KYQ94357.1 cystatin A2 [Tieghemostelium lacteum]